MAEGLRRLRAGPRDVLALVREDGHILVRSTGQDRPLPRVRDGTPFHMAVAEGLRDTVFTSTSAVNGQPQLTAIRRIEGFPIYASANRPRSAILAHWRAAVLTQVAIGVPATLALLGLALLVRRGQRQLLAANSTLEARVTERTAELEELYEALDLAPSLVVDLKGIIRYWSAGCERLYGYSRAEAHGQWASDLLHTEYPPGGREAALEALRRDGEWYGELRQRRRDGAPMIVACHWILRNDPATGAPLAIVSTRADLTPLRETERALHESEARLRRAQEASGVIGFEVGPEGMVAASDAFLALFGLPPGMRLDVARLLPRIHPEDHAMLRAGHARLAREGGSFGGEFRVVWPDGTLHWLLLRGEAEADPARDRPRRIAGVALDITERRLAEAALAESEERLRLAQQAAGIGIYDYDFLTGDITWDARLRALWAVPENMPITNRLFIEGLHPEDRPLRREAVRRAMDPQGTGLYRVEYRIIGLGDGVERWVAATGQVRFAGNRPVRLVGTVHDITERKRTEQRNALLMREVDHRAKNALAVVQAALRLTRADNPAEFVRSVEGRVAALARAQTVLAQRRWEGAELRALVEGELAPFLDEAHPGGPRIQLSGPPVTVGARAAQPLCMALHELATNAVKYGALSVPEGMLAVTWRLDPAERMLHLVWRESGGPDLAAPPARRGFGSRVIEQTLQLQLGGTLSRRWLPGGLGLRDGGAARP
ncbi:PAS domain-containing protein [Siccirubricoccus sp. G192]|uniref:PAS domain-containing protein n=1 Tax=Siccirubricoccus sp. G192 TaxID=2849651 RepID=UPI001C2BD99E|nr:PAS domain-containing protein [Siccirubricoccus sp. G192]MBV1799472.1 PAS domain-containing protein [Siccirubricoccus sp. G192]